MIYLDHAATTPMSRTALDVYVKAAEEFFANPSSLHEQGDKTKQLLDKCRSELSQLIHAHSDEIYFTSGGTESNIRALQSLYLGCKDKGNHVITTVLEHPSVQSFFVDLEKNGVEVTYLGVDTNGVISIEELEKSLRSDTILASIQHINSEIGVIQPIREIGNLLKKHGVLFHSDCVQSFGKIPIEVDTFSIDAISISSHKVYGPKGVGAVYLSRNTPWKAVDAFTSHEGGFRPGTVNTPGIAAFTTAAVDAVHQLDNSIKYMWELRALLINELSDISHLITIEGGTDSEKQLPHIIGLGIKGIEGQYMLLTLDRHGVCISTGSACQAGKQDPSIAMKALGKSTQEAKRFFRISLGRHTTQEEIIETAKQMKACVYEKEGIKHDRQTKMAWGRTEK
ncbi:MULTISPECIES: IscS subfamily cysteine desulfurase [Bacillaceae]|uniref:IscS subfamily cysteine desulfurase n=1 Tax=Evansella alkalicola TaxID=745819 RepID=A0ABS6JRQ4_9BACI|nr:MULTISPECIES: IscS subfamily cysteine desulfurase [Bacillaceae]MBU9720766.1 IscS subfamily cysteine desulfurase [Bacillus alkalicola]